MTHLKPSSTIVVLYQGDDMAELADLSRRVEIARRIVAVQTVERTGTERAGDGDASLDGAREDLAAAEAAYDEFVDVAAERALEVEIHAIGREFFRDLVAEHRPRMVERKAPPLAEGEAPAAPEMVEHEDDEHWHINTETFPAALLTFRRRDEDGDEPELVATIARPEFSTDAKVKRFVNRELSEGQFETLWQAAYFLNRSPVADPKALRHSMSSSASISEI
jgi:hypothetical protein